MKTVLSILVGILMIPLMGGTIRASQVSPSATPSATPVMQASTTPGAVWTTTQAGAPTAAVGTPGVAVTGPSEYAIQQGDTLSSIALQHDITVGQLLLMNPGFDRSTILYPGISLEIPALNAAGPTANISPITGVPSTTITVTAVGFGANQLVRVGFGPVNGDVLQLDLTQVSASGAFNRTYAIPSTANRDGQYVFVVQQADQPSEHAVTNVFTLVGTGTALATGIPVTGLQGGATRSGTRGSLLTISPTIAGAGDIITVTALGFPPNSNVDVRIAEDGSNTVAGVVDAVADSAGQVEKTLPVPASAKFGQTWVVTVETTDRVAVTHAESTPITIDR